VGSGRYTLARRISQEAVSRGDRVRQVGGAVIETESSRSPSRGLNELRFDSVPRGVHEGPRRRLSRLRCRLCEVPLGQSAAGLRLTVSLTVRPHRSICTGVGSHRRATSRLTVSEPAQHSLKPECLPLSRCQPPHAAVRQPVSASALLRAKRVKVENGWSAHDRRIGDFWATDASS